MKDTKLSAKARDQKGKAASGRLRRTGWFPAVVYGEGRPGVDIQVNEHDFVMMLRSHRSENMILDLVVEGTDKPYKVMLKALQHHPLSGRIIHVDFYEVSMTRKIEVDISIHLSGTPVGVTNEGGVLEHGHRTITVSCLPGDVPDEIVADISGVHVGDSFRVSDLQVDAAKLEILDDPEQVLASVAVPRVDVEKTAAEGAEGAGGEAAAGAGAEKAEAGEAGAEEEKKE